MKNTIVLKQLLFCLALICGGTLYAQDTTVHPDRDTTGFGEDVKNAAKKTGKAIKKGAEKVGDKTAELAAKGKAVIADAVYKDKQGPAGQTIYVTNDQKYYWIDKEGHRQFILESELKDKP